MGNLNYSDRQDVSVSSQQDFYQLYHDAEFRHLVSSISFMVSSSTYGYL